MSLHEFNTPRLQYLLPHILNCLCILGFHQDIDYIFTVPYYIWFRAPHFGYACSLLHYWIVVEPSSVRGLAADCPIFIVFKHSHLRLFHRYAVVNKALRGFQQLKELIHICFHICQTISLI